MDKKERWIYRRIRGLEFEAVAKTDAEKNIEQELNELRAMVTAPLLRMARRLKKLKLEEIYAKLSIYFWKN